MNLNTTGNSAQRLRLFVRAYGHVVMALFLVLGVQVCASAVDGPMGVERVARLIPEGYRSKPGASDDDIKWVQVDLGKAQKIEAVKLLPMVDWGCNSISFPVRFKIEASDDPAFSTASKITDCTGSDYPTPNDVVGIFKATGISGRYVRLTVTKLRDKQFVLAMLEVWSNGKTISTGCAVSDSSTGYLGKIALTRKPRPQGEEVVTDNPGNVIPADQWHPVPYKAQTPLSGVRVDDGVFKTTMENNVAYLLNSFSEDELLRPFRERAGKPLPSGMRPPIPFWDTDLPGSNAGRFLMGAGNTIRWMDSPELKDRLNRIVDGIDECKQPDGFIMGYPENTIFWNERAAYTRSWLTHGLIEAGFAGNQKAFTLLRGNYDWFDTNPYLRELLRRGGQGVQGMIANARMYFTPVGKPEDLQVIQRYFQENYWIKGLAEHNPAVIWQYPYDHPHNYLITSLEPYLDMYRATGAKKYLDAAQGGWDLYHDDWEHIGGCIAICEGDVYPPKSNYLHRHTGELCGNVFWIRYNQRFHLLNPDQERYVAEIEKSIYNICLPNQVGSKGIRYHANMIGKQDEPTFHNSCCEGQGTRLYGSLPEYIYSIAKDGVYIDLYEGSSIEWKQNGQTIKLHMVSTFPASPDINIHLTVSQPVRTKIHVRVPAWATDKMPILVNGVKVATGEPGAYVTLNRTWADNDTVSFTLPIRFKLTQYVGQDEYNGRERYALEYGPVLMAVVGEMDDKGDAQLRVKPTDLIQHLKPVAGEPLHFAIDGDTKHEYVPYWQVNDRPFTCFPTVDDGAPRKADTVEAGDLALAGAGATATSDSELDREPGCTAKVIDGIIATTSDFANRWHSSVATPHPHWVEVKLAKPALVGRVVVRFADPGGYPVSFQGIATDNGKSKVVFKVKTYNNTREYRANIKPVMTDRFRFIIRESANPSYAAAAQISEIELYAPKDK